MSSDYAAIKKRADEIKKAAPDTNPADALSQAMREDPARAERYMQNPAPPVAKSVTPPASLATLKQRADEWITRETERLMKSAGVSKIEAAQQIMRDPVAGAAYMLATSPRTDPAAPAVFGLHALNKSLDADDRDVRAALDYIARHIL